jgi:hypothetical protein
MYVDAWRYGSNIKMLGRFTAGTNSGAEARLYFPSGLTAGTQSANTNIVGKWWINNSTTAQAKQGTLHCLGSDAYAKFGVDDYTVAVSPGSALIGTQLPSTTVIWVELEFPINEWAGNGTLNLGQGAQVEYAYNTSTSTSASDTTSFGYGPAGAQIQNITAGVSRRVRFQYPIQVDDVIEIQVSEDRIKWVTLDQSFWATNGGAISSWTRQNTTDFGLGRVIPIASNVTDLDIGFAAYSFANGASFAAAGQAWSAGSGACYWRVRKTKASAPVGFGMAGTDGSAGLYKPGQAPGQPNNATIGAGYIGERISANSAGVNVGATTVSVNICSITLTPGVWCVAGQYSLSIGTISGWTYAQVNISTSSGTADSNANGGLVGWYPGSSTSMNGSPGTATAGPRFISVAAGSTQTVYLVGRIDYTSQSSSTWNLNSRIDAVRIG